MKYKVSFARNKLIQIKTKKIKSHSDQNVAGKVRTPQSVPIVTNMTIDTKSPSILLLSVVIHDLAFSIQKL